MKVLTRRKILKFVTYILITIGAILMILPFLWMISTSFKNPLKVYELPIKWIPETFNIKNYTRLFTEYNFSLYIFNSLKLAALNIIGNVLSCSLVAYGFSFLRHRYKNKIFVLLLATMMLPGAVTFFPQFILFNHIGWYGTTLPLWVPAFCGSAFYC